MEGRSVTFPDTSEIEELDDAEEEAAKATGAKRKKMKRRK
jgi:hypothetical protein